MNFFELTAVSYVSHSRYPTRRLNNIQCGYFSDLNEAENGLRAIIKTNQMEVEERRAQIMCFYIREFFLDQCPKFWQGSLRSCRSYYGDGSFNTEVAVNDFNGELIPYLGRKVVDIKFKIGDIVECVEGDEFSRLGIVAALPWTVDEVLTFDEKMRSHVLDYSDDCYMVYFLGSGDTHSHPLSCNVFTPVRKVSLNLIEELQKKLKEHKEISRSCPCY